MGSLLSTMRARKSRAINAIKIHRSSSPQSANGAGRPGDNTPKCTLSGVEKAVAACIAVYPHRPVEPLLATRERSSRPNFVTLAAHTEYTERHMDGDLGLGGTLSGGSPSNTGSTESAGIDGRSSIHSSEANIEFSLAPDTNIPRDTPAEVIDGISDPSSPNLGYTDLPEGPDSGSRRRVAHRVPYSTSSNRVSFNRVTLTTDNGRLYSVFRVEVKLDHQGQEVNYEVVPQDYKNGDYHSPTTRGYSGRKIIVFIYDICAGGLRPTAIVPGHIPRDIRLDQGTVVDYGGESGYWVCEFLSWSGVDMGVCLDPAGLEPVDIVVGEGDFGFGWMD